MVDHLKVTSSPLNKEPIIKPSPSNNQYINISDPNKVIKPNDKDAFNQNKPNNSLDFNYQSLSAKTLKLLMNTDTIGDTIKRLIFHDETFFNALSTSSQQSIINQFMNGFFINGDQILDCIKSQCLDNSSFSGDFFNIIKEIFLNNGENKTIQESILSFLKSFDRFISRHNTIQFLNFNLSNLIPFLNHQDAQSMQQLIHNLLYFNNTDHYNLNQVLATRKEILSILSDLASHHKEDNQLRNMIMLAVHNLSRLDQTDRSSLMDNLDKLFFDLQRYHQLSANQKNLLIEKFNTILNQIDHQEHNVLNQIVEALDNGLSQTSPLPLQLVSSQILSTLLLNQSVLLPLIYCFIPIKLDDAYVFGELWIKDEHNTKSKNSKSKSDQSVQLFFSLEASVLGYFQGVIQLDDNLLTIHLEGPEAALPALKGLSKHLEATLSSTNLKLSSCNLSPLVTPKTFFDVFGKDVLKEAYINVRI